MLDDVVNKELVSKTFTHHARWHLFYHLFKVKFTNDTPLVEDLKPIDDLEAFLHLFTYINMTGSIFRKTIPSALTPEGVHAVINHEDFIASREIETDICIDENMFVPSDNNPLPDANYPLILVFTHGIRNEIKKYILEKKRNATIKALEESKTQITAVDLTKKALTKLLAGHDVNDGHLLDVIASHVGQAEKDWVKNMPLSKRKLPSSKKLSNLQRLKKTLPVPPKSLEVSPAPEI